MAASILRYLASLLSRPFQTVLGTASRRPASNVAPDSRWRKMADGIVESADDGPTSLYDESSQGESLFTRADDAKGPVPVLGRLARGLDQVWNLILVGSLLYSIFVLFPKVAFGNAKKSVGFAKRVGQKGASVVS